MKASLIYIAKFIGIFLALYLGTLLVIALASDDGRLYSPFVQHYFDYVSWLKESLIHGSAFILSLFGISTYQSPGFVFSFTGGRGVYIAYSCVGYGVYSFWIAFVVANRGNWRKKTLWAIGGVLSLWLINVIRITLFITAVNKDWPMPLGLDHHTWFNIVAYTFIVLMILLYDRTLKRGQKHEDGGSIGN